MKHRPGAGCPTLRGFRNVRFHRLLSRKIVPSLDADTGTCVGVRQLADSASYFNACNLRS